MKFLHGLVAGALLIVAVPVCAQSLGDLAKKEAERRKASPPAAKTYTNEDLKKLSPVIPVAGEAEPTKVEDVAKPAPVKGETAKDADPAKDEKYWHGRITAAKEELRRNQSFRDALQTRIDVLTIQFTARDNSADRTQVADDRQKAMVELDRVTSEIDRATKQIADIEEEARRANVPPGWLR